MPTGQIMGGRAFGEWIIKFDIRHSSSSYSYFIYRRYRIYDMLACGKVQSRPEFKCTYVQKRTKPMGMIWI
jgi:hypothetical protein